MSVIWQTIFDEGDWSAWDGNGSSRAAPFPAGYGAGGGPSNTCNHGGSFLGANYKYATPPVPATGTWGLHDLAVRFQYAILANKNFDSGLTYCAVVQDVAIGGPAVGNGFQAILGIKSDGSVVLKIINADLVITPVPSFQTPTYQIYASAPGVFPVDGTIHGVQVLLSNLTPTSVDYEVLVDDASLFSGTHVPTGSVCTGWGYFSGGFTCGNYVQQAGMVEVDIVHYRDPVTGPVDVMTNCAEVVLDDDPSAVSYPAGTAPAIGEFTCYQPAAPTALSVSCGAGQIIIDGTDFDPGASVELQGPEGVIETFNVVSITPTRIILDTLDPPFVDGGRYCVTVTNPLV